MGFATEIQPLFRQQDQRAMRQWFDLFSYADVREHADAIVERLEDGDMPCDGAWPDSDIQTFRAWIEHGCPA